MISREHLTDPDWRGHLGPEFEQPYMRQLQGFLAAEATAGKQLFPPSAQVFEAFNATPLSQVRVVILGQDPYHGPGQAHGLCFSVQQGVKPPPSLVNIFKEIERDLGLAIPDHGCLDGWAHQGVLLLNATLTVESGQAGAHQGQGWERFTDAAIGVVNEVCDAVVFLLWGSHAQKKRALIDGRRHPILTAPHPSPLSAYRGFLGCGHFSAVNEHLRQQGRTPIDWALAPAATVQGCLAL